MCVGFSIFYIVCHCFYLHSAGFEKDVGSKTTHVLVNRKSLFHSQVQLSRQWFAAQLLTPFSLMCVYLFSGLLINLIAIIIETQQLYWQCYISLKNLGLF